MDESLTPDHRRAIETVCLDLACSEAAHTSPAPLITAKQVAVRLGISVRTVWRWVEDETLRAVRIGGVVRFQPDDIARLAGLTITTTDNSSIAIANRQIRTRLIEIPPSLRKDAARVG